MKSWPWPCPCLPPFLYLHQQRKKNGPINVKCITVGWMSVFHSGFFSLTNHLVGLHCGSGSPHMAAASFRANLLNLMDSEKAFGLHVLAHPTLCFLSLFLPLQLTLCSLLIIRTSSQHLDILPPLLSVSSLLWLLEVLQHSLNRSDP